jgi:hypothetical protein
MYADAFCKYKRAACDPSAWRNFSGLPSVTIQIDRIRPTFGGVNPQSEFIRTGLRPVFFVFSRRKAMNKNSLGRENS